MDDPKRKERELNTKERRIVRKGAFTCRKVVEAPTQNVAEAHRRAPKAMTWARLWREDIYAANGKQSIWTVERSRVRLPRLVGDT